MPLRPSPYAAWKPEDVRAYQQDEGARYQLAHCGRWQTFTTAPFSCPFCGAMLLTAKETAPCPTSPSMAS